MTFGQAECQSWVAGVEGGGSGINLFIPLPEDIPENIQWDSIYFRGKVAKLEIIDGTPLMLVGRFKKQFNQKKDIVMSSDSNLEYGNELLKLEDKIPFDLKDYECVISYIRGSKKEYYKFEKVIEKTPEYYPSAPPNRG